MHKLMQRRQALLARIAGQREQMADLSTRWQPALSVADQALEAARFVRTHAVLVAGVAGLLLVRRRGVIGVMKGGWRAWKTWRYLSDYSERIAPK